MREPQRFFLDQQWLDFKTGEYVPVERLEVIEAAAYDELRVVTLEEAAKIAEKYCESDDRCEYCGRGIAAAIRSLKEKQEYGMQSSNDLVDALRSSFFFLTSSGFAPFTLPAASMKSNELL